MKMINVRKLRAGDVLVCYKKPKFKLSLKAITFKLFRKAITIATDSEYTHAAICINSGEAAESTTLGGVSKVKIDDLIKRYDHVAVFRHPDAWKHPERTQGLNTFIDNAVASGAKYNLRDVVTFIKRSEDHKYSINDKIHAFFGGTCTSNSTVKSSYFCSELVATCFIITGAIGPSAAVLLQPDVMSPGALGQDPAYGTFLGYVSSAPHYCVPATDEFFNKPTFDEIYVDEASDDALSSTV